MPQREFWATAHPSSVRWHYSFDPSAPERPSRLSMTVYDQGGSMMEYASIDVPVELTHECVGTALAESWEGFLFGERHAGPRAMQLVRSRFGRLQARLRSIKQ